MLRESMRAVEKIGSIKIFDGGGMVNGADHGAVSASLRQPVGALAALPLQLADPRAPLNEAGFNAGSNPIYALVGGMREGKGGEPARVALSGVPIKVGASWPRPGGTLNPPA